MIKTSEQVTILPKPGLTYFQFHNRKTFDTIFGGINMKLGKYMAAINELSARHTLNTMLLRNLLGVNPDSVNINWDELVRSWWSTISINISQLGYTMEIGLSYDINDPLRKQYISKLPNITTDEQLAEYVNTKIKIDDRFMYGTPLNILQYLQYLFILIHKEVANDIKDIDKSTNIKFYLHTDKAAKRQEEELAKLHIETSTLLVELQKEPKKVKQVLRTYNLLDGVTRLPISTDENTNIITMTNLVMQNPRVFKLLVGDPKLKEKAFISSLFDNNVIARLVGSDTIVLSTDNNTILGSSVEEVINYLTDSKNVDMLKMVENQLKALLNK